MKTTSERANRIQISLLSDFLSSPVCTNLYDSVPRTDTKIYVSKSINKLSFKDVIPPNETDKESQMKISAKIASDSNELLENSLQLRTDKWGR